MQVHAGLKRLGLDVPTAAAGAMTPELANALYATDLGRYGRTIATQSGHVVTGILPRADPTTLTKPNLGTHMHDWAHLPRGFSDGGKVLPAYRALMASITVPDGKGGERPLAKSDYIHVGFDIVLILEPKL